MGHNPTLKEVKDIIETVDADNTGEIEFDEFVELMQKMKESGPIGRTYVCSLSLFYDEI